MAKQKTKKIPGQTKINKRRRNTSIIDSESSECSSSPSIRQKKSTKKIEKESPRKVQIDDNKHYDEIHVKKFSTYKQGSFKNKNMRTFSKSIDVYSLKYMEIANRFSIRPKKKVCEFTGLPAMFTCPYTRLSYYDSSVYKHIKTLSSDVINFIYETKEMCKNFNPFYTSK
ncbi:hypothetical protein P3W45_001319 [Vairimorpha bombi]|jgi:INO80 complex subunit C